jgi:hypothetical protein
MVPDEYQTIISLSMDTESGRYKKQREQKGCGPGHHNDSYDYFGITNNLEFKYSD